MPGKYRLTVKREKAATVATVFDESARPIIAIHRHDHAHGDDLIVWIYTHVPGPRNGLLSYVVTYKRTWEFASKILAPIGGGTGAENARWIPRAPKYSGALHREPEQLFLEARA